MKYCSVSILAIVVCGSMLDSSPGRWSLVMVAESPGRGSRMLGGSDVIGGRTGGCVGRGGRGKGLVWS